MKKSLDDKIVMSNSLEDALQSRIAAASRKSAPAVDPIPRRQSDIGNIPLSSGQHRLWYMAQIEPDSAVYNLVEANRLTGKLDVRALEHALDKILQRHEVLRTELCVVDEAPVQQVREEWQVDLEPIDFSTRTEDELRREISEEVLKPFDLKKVPLFRWRLYKRSDFDHVLLLIAHHSIIDGISISRLFKEAGEFYRSFIDGVQAEVQPVGIQYADYAVWQRDWLESDEASKQLDYWVKLHNGEDTPLDLPLDFPRPHEQSYNGSAVRKKLGGPSLSGFENLLKQEKCTVFMGLLSLFSVLLHKYSRQENINIGVPSSGRGHRDVEDTIGFFANTLVYHHQVGPDDTFVDHLRKTRSMCLESLRNQDVPFDQVVSAINPPRDISRTPLFQAFLGYQDQRGRDFDFGNVQLQPYESDINVARTDITLWVEHDKDGLSLALEYCTELFSEATAIRILEHLDNLMRRSSENPDSPIWQLNLLTDTDRHLQLTANDKLFDFEYSDALSLVADSARKHSDSTAIIFGEQQLSYATLMQHAVAIAGLLERNQVPPESIVGIYMERSPLIIAAILGIWMAGCAYLPLDPDFPVSRLQYMVDKAKAAAILSDTSSRSGEISGPQFISIDSVLSVEPQGDVPDVPDVSDVSDRITGESLGYVIFTSGSTGQPKGVLVPQRAIANFLQSMSIRPGFSSKNRILAITTLSFDISVLELLLPLAVGGSVVVATKEDAIDASRLSRLLTEFEIDTLQATPATWKMLLSEDWRPDGSDFRALCGGEAMPENIATGLLGAGCQLWNMYGPTETTIWSTCSRMKDGQSDIDLGQPIHNTECFVVDDRNQLCPVGVPGELLISGDGLSDGYIGEPELTDARFVDLDLMASIDSRKAYKTGDIVVRTAQGSLLYKGREDGQIKLRGFRIEIGDIEASLVAIDGIIEAAVIVKVFGASDSRLQAFIHFEKGAQLPTTELRRKLGKLLPAYMIPQQFIQIAEMPLTANGKVDRIALNQLGASQQATYGQVDPVTEAEKKIAAIWSEALQVKRVSVDKCFFDIGGHSLLAIRVIQDVHRELGFRISPRDMMLNTLQQIAKSLPVDQIAAADSSEVTGSSALKRLRGLLTGSSSKVERR